MWRAYGIGPGKFIKWTDLSLPTGIPKLNEKSEDNSNNIVPVNETHTRLQAAEMSDC